MGGQCEREGLIVVRGGKKCSGSALVAFAVELFWPREKIPGLFLVLMSAYMLKGEVSLVEELV